MDLRKEEAILAYKLDQAKQTGKIEGIQIGTHQGKIEGKIEVAKTMLANNVDAGTIVKFTGLSLDEIEKLLK
ncbi:MAG: hypothetical protein sGL2_07950 [Candidatus Mesenet longicola]|nr:MAG: hypothetical protein sGL2_07950 [Candidatus Mesenet longicola]